VKIGAQSLTAAEDFREEWPILWAIGRALPTGIEAKGARMFIEQWWDRKHIVWSHSALDDRPPAFEAQAPLPLARPPRWR
jgi:hypothetical protein